MDKLLKVENITKSFGKNVVLSNISFELEKAEILILAGENGTGKSTLLSIITTLVKPDSGGVFLESDNIINRPKLVKGRIAYVPQEISLHDNLSVRDNMYFWAKMSGLKGSELKSKVAELMEEFKLTKYEKHKTKKLSVGLRRRISIAITLFSNVELVIMDEPTAGLDVETKKEIMGFIKGLKKAGKAIIYVTHISDEVEALADKVLKINLGIGQYYNSIEEYKEYQSK